jgi:hypothetical protein
MRLVLAVVSSVFVSSVLSATTPALARSVCETITPRAYQLRAKLDALRLDYSAVYLWVCLTFETTLPRNPPPSEVVAKMTGSQAACSRGLPPKDCTFVISEFIAFAQGIGALQDLARQNACAVPSFPDPC